MHEYLPQNQTAFNAHKARCATPEADGKHSHETLKLLRTPSSVQKDPGLTAEESSLLAYSISRVASGVPRTNLFFRVTLLL